jgi:hypothetical protein
MVVHQKKEYLSIVQELHIPMHPTVESEEIRLESSEIMAGASVDAEAKFVRNGGFSWSSSYTFGGGDKTFGWVKSNSKLKR